MPLTSYIVPHLRKGGTKGVVENEYYSSMYDKLIYKFSDTSFKKQGVTTPYLKNLF